MLDRVSGGTAGTAQARIDGTGDEPAVLLLHGQPGWGFLWEPVRARLDPGLTVLAPDRPGWGDNPDRAGDFAVNARAAAAVLDAAGAQRALVVAHSWAGGPALRLALDDPERVAGLVLLAPAVTPDAYDRLDRVLATRPGAVLSAGALLVSAAVALGPGARRLVAPEIDLHRLARRLAERRTRRAFAVEQRAALAEVPALTERLGEVRAPALLVTGERDRIVPSACVRAAGDALPGARCVSVPDAGHMLPMSRPGHVAAAIRDAVERVAAA